MPAARAAAAHTRLRLRARDVPDRGRRGRRAPATPSCGPGSSRRRCSRSRSSAACCAATSRSSTPSCARGWRSCRRRASGSSRPATRSASGSSATSTTARSRASWRSRCSSSSCASASTATPSLRRSSSAPRRSCSTSLAELRELARGIHPPMLTERGLGRRSTARRPRARPGHRRGRRRRAAAAPGRDRRLLRRLGGADERGEVRAGDRGQRGRAACERAPHRRDQRRRRGRRGRRRAARACAGSATASPRSTARSRSTAHPAAGRGCAPSSRSRPPRRRHRRRGGGRGASSACRSADGRRRWSARVPRNRAVPDAPLYLPVPPVIASVNGPDVLLALDLDEPLQRDLPALQAERDEDCHVEHVIGRHGVDVGADDAAHADIATAGNSVSEITNSSPPATAGGCEVEELELGLLRDATGADPSPCRVRTRWCGGEDGERGEHERGHGEAAGIVCRTSLWGTVGGRGGSGSGPTDARPGRRARSTALRSRD